jgi:PBP1b-binding outer membrane lipoprotein LpoB
MDSKRSRNWMLALALSTVILAGCRQRFPDPGEPVAKPPANTESAAPGAQSDSQAQSGKRSDQ